MIHRIYQQSYKRTNQQRCFVSTSSDLHDLIKNYSISPTSEFFRLNSPKDEALVLKLLKNNRKRIGVVQLKRDFLDALSRLDEMDNPIVALDRSLCVVKSINKGKLPFHDSYIVHQVLLSNIVKKFSTDNLGTPICGKLLELCDLIKELVLSVLVTHCDTTSLLLIGEEDIRNMGHQAIAKILNKFRIHGFKVKDLIGLLKAIQVGSLQFIATGTVDNFVSSMDDQQVLILENISKNLALKDTAKNKKEQTSNGHFISASQSKLRLLMSRIRSCFLEYSIEYSKTRPVFRKQCFHLLQSALYCHKGLFYSLSFSDNVVMSSLLSSVRLVENQTEKSVDEIRRILPELDSELDDIVRNVEYDKEGCTGYNILTEGMFHVSNKSGPNGSLALSKIPYDTFAVANDPILKGHIVNWCQALKIEGIDTLFAAYNKPEVLSQYLVDHKDDKKPLEGPLHSRFLAFMEEGGKQRVVAEVDWITQSLLKHLESIAVSLVKGSSSFGGTYDQDRSFCRVHAGSIATGEFGGADLTAATDLMPRTLQSIVVERLLHKATGVKGMGKLWSNLIADREFYFDEKFPSIKYAYGQPMGAKSSWIIMHLTNSILLRISKKRALKGNPLLNVMYESVGDDVASNSVLLNNNYIGICEDLGMKISQPKSVKSVATENFPVVCEFLKIISIGEYSLKPISPKVFKNFLNDPRSHIFDLFKKLFSLGIDIDLNPYLSYLVKFDKLGISEEKKMKRSFSSNEELKNVELLIEEVIIFLIAPEDIGGLGIPTLQVCRAIDPSIALPICSIYNDREVTDSQRISFEVNKINRSIDRESKALNSSVGSLLSRDGWDSFEKSIKNDSTDSTETNGDESSNEYLKYSLSPTIQDNIVFRLVLKVLFDSKKVIADKKKAYIDSVGLITKRIVSGITLDSDLNDILESAPILKKSTLIPFDSFLLPSESDIEREVNGLSKPVITEFKRINLIKAQDAKNTEIFGQIKSIF
jgi:hypothetical protein